MYVKATKKGMTIRKALAYYTKKFTTVVKSFMMQAPVAEFTSYYFLRNLRMGPINFSVTLHKTRKTSKGLTL